MSVFTDPCSPRRPACRWLYPADRRAAGFREQPQFGHRHPELRRGDVLLSGSADKPVRKIRLPREVGSAAAAYKFCRGRTPWRHIIALPRPARERRNHQVLSRGE